MNNLPFKFDEIGSWSELKLEIVEKYGAAYTKAFTNSAKLKKYYISTVSAGPAFISPRKPKCRLREVRRAP